MKSVWLIASLSVFLGCFTYSFGDPMESCVGGRNESYAIGDTKQCDAYYACTTKGELLERLCDDGFVFSTAIKQCDYPHNVDCRDRPELQPAQTSHDCPRANGFYAFPPSDSCQKFHHCLEGVAYEKTCPEGVIFDPSKGACVHPDLSRRPECHARTVLNFTCPNADKQFVRLRFGDHDRHAHPSDCRKFLICLKDGKPRLGGCPIGKVFNGKTGYCDKPKRVHGCEAYYGKKSNLIKLALAEASGHEEDEIDVHDPENSNLDDTEDDSAPIKPLTPAPQAQSTPAVQPQPAKSNKQKSG